MRQIASSPHCGDHGRWNYALLQDGRAAPGVPHPWRQSCQMAGATADNRVSQSFQHLRGNAALWAVQSASIAALRAARLQCENLSLGGFKGGYSLSQKRISPFARSPAGTQGFSVCLDKQYQSWYAERNKGSEKEAFSFHPLKRGDGRCKSLRNGKGGAFEPRGGNAAPVPPLQGNEVPHIQRGIQVEPRTMICSP